jgi:hypothetical protein
MKLWECSKCSQRWMSDKAPVCLFDGSVAWLVPFEKVEVSED